MADHTETPKGGSDNLVTEKWYEPDGKCMNPEDPILNPAAPFNMAVPQFITFPPCYPNWGMFHTLQEHQRVFPDIAWWDKKTQAKYRDAPGQRYALNPTFIEKQKKLWANYQKNFKITDMTSFSVGNMAFISLLHPHDKELQDAYEFVVSQVKSAFPRTST